MYVYIVFTFGFGVWGFFWGFKKLRRKRLIENIPTYTVRGMTMGLVELIGKAESEECFKSPISNTESVWCKYLIEEHRSRGRSRQWVKVAIGDTSYLPFMLNDGTGKVMVTPAGAELVLDLHYRFKTSFRKETPVHLIDLLRAHGVRHAGIFGKLKLRFREWIIKPGQTVYVMGSAKKLDKPEDDHKNILVERIRQLKQDPEKMKSIDLNNDGNISAEEWDLAVKNLERELLEEKLSKMDTDHHADINIGKGETETFFLISDHSEERLIRKLFYQSLLGIYGGAILAIVSFFLVWNITVVTIKM